MYYDNYRAVSQILVCVLLDSSSFGQQRLCVKIRRTKTSELTVELYAAKHAAVYVGSSLGFETPPKSRSIQQQQ